MTCWIPACLHLNNKCLQSQDAKGCNLLQGGNHLQFSDERKQMVSPLCTNLPVCFRKLRFGEQSWSRVNSSPGKGNSTKMTSSRFTENCLSFYGSVACRQIAYCFSRILAACFNSSLLSNLFVAIASRAVPSFIWAAPWQSNVVPAASSTVVQYQSVLHSRVRKADSHLGFTLVLLLSCTWEERLSELNVYLKKLWRKFWRKFWRKCVSEEIRQLRINLCPMYLLSCNVWSNHRQVEYQTSSDPTGRLFWVTLFYLSWVLGWWWGFWLVIWLLLVWFSILAWGFFVELSLRSPP